MSQVMHPNGVSHLEVGNDQEGVDKILQWLSYVPATVNHAPPARPITDPVEREVRLCADFSRPSVMQSTCLTAYPASRNRTRIEQGKYMTRELTVVRGKQGARP